MYISSKRKEHVREHGGDDLTPLRKAERIGMSDRGRFGLTSNQMLHRTVSRSVEIVVRTWGGACLFYVVAFSIY